MEQFTRYATTKELLLLVFLGFLTAVIYTVPLGIHVWGSQKFWWFVLFSFCFSLVMTCSKVNVGEIGHILILSFDTKLRCGPGIYPTPTMLPFLRGIGIPIGVTVEVPSEQHEGNIKQIRIFQNQLLPVYTINTQAGLFSSLFSRCLSTAWVWVSDIYEPNGKIKYYKIGGLGYGGTWLVSMLFV